MDCFETQGWRILEPFQFGPQWDKYQTLHMNTNAFLSPSPVHTNWKIPLAKTTRKQVMNVFALLRKDILFFLFLYIGPLSTSL